MTTSLRLDIFFESIRNINDNNEKKINLCNTENIIPIYLNKKALDNLAANKTMENCVKIIGETIEYEKKTCIKFENDNYTFSEFQKEMNKLKFKTEEEMVTALVTKSRRVIIRVRIENFYIVKVDNKEIKHLFCNINHIKRSFNFTIRYGNGIETKFSKLLEYVTECNGLINDSCNNSLGKFNIWNDMLVRHVEKIDETKIKPLLNFINEVWAHKNPKIYDYLINWFGKMMSNEKTGVLLFMKRRELFEKELLTEFFEKFVLGINLYSFVSSVKMFEKYSEMNMGKKLICIRDNIALIQKRQNKSLITLKQWLTEPTIKIKRHYSTRLYNINPIANFIYFINHNQNTNIGYIQNICFEYSDTWINEEKKIEEIRAICFNSDSANHFYTYCTTYKTAVNICNVNPLQFTLENIEIKQPPEIKFLKEFKIEHDHTIQKEKEILSNVLHKKYITWCERNKEFPLPITKFALVIKNNIKKKKTNIGMVYDKGSIHFN